MSSEVETHQEDEPLGRREAVNSESWKEGAHHRGPGLKRQGAKSHHIGRPLVHPAVNQSYFTLK